MKKSEVEEYVASRIKKNTEHYLGDRVTNIYIYVLMTAVFVSLIFTFFANLPLLGNTDNRLFLQFNNTLQTPMFDGTTIPTVVTGLATLLLWGWATYNLGPLAIPMNELVWIYQHPVDRKLRILKQIMKLAVVAVVYGIAAGLAMCSFGVIKEGWKTTYTGILVIQVTFTILILASAIVMQFKNVNSNITRTRESANGLSLIKKIGIEGFVDWPSLSGAASRGVVMATSAMSLDPSGIVRVIFPNSEKINANKNSGSYKIKYFEKAPVGILLVFTELKILLKSKGALFFILITTFVSIILIISPLIRSPVLLYFAIWLMACAVGEIAGSGLKHGQGNIYRYSFWPISQRNVRWLQLVVPTVVMVTWAITVIGGMGFITGNLLVVVESILSGVGMGAINAYTSDRVIDGNSQEMFMATPFGPLPIKTIWKFLQGYLFTGFFILVPWLTLVGKGNGIDGGVLLVVGVIVALFILSKRES